jgi:hypothetical protein
MWNGFIGQTIASTSRTLRTLGKILMFIVLAILVYSSRKIINLAVGPAKLDERQLTALTSPSLRDYATVEGRDTDTTGVEAIQRSTRNGVVESEKVTGEYMMTVVGKHLLVVKAKPHEKAGVYTGAVVTLPPDLKTRIFSGAKDADEIEAATFPVILDASKEYADDDFWSGIGGAVLLGLIALRLFYLYKKRTDSPEKHPLAKAIAQYGPIYSLVPQIDAEVAAGSAYLLGVRMTDNWLISCTITKSTVMRRDEIVWAYKKRTKHSVNFIPTGTTYSSVLRDSRGKAFEISGSNEQQVEGFLDGVLKQTPWVVVGFDKEINKLYTKNLTEFSSLVAKRRATLGGT